MNWTDFLEFTRGPLFQLSLIIFILGMSYRLVRILLLGWRRDRVHAQGSKAAGIGKSYLKGIIILPFIPWVKDTFRRNPVPYLAGGFFHLGLFIIIFLSAAHMLVWKSLLGFGWPTLKTPIVDWFAAVAIAALIILLINRLSHPVLRLISGPAQWLSWLFVFLPMLTGYIMVHHFRFSYDVLFSLHMLTVDFLLIWIPLSSISHFMFYFFSRTIHGQEFGKRAVNP